MIFGWSQVARISRSASAYFALPDLTKCFFSSFFAANTLLFLRCVATTTCCSGECEQQSELRNGRRQKHPFRESCQRNNQFPMVEPSPHRCLVAGNLATPAVAFYSFLSSPSQLRSWQPNRIQQNQVDTRLQWPLGAVTSGAGGLREQACITVTDLFC